MVLLISGKCLGGLLCVHLSPLSSPHSHTGMPASLLFCHDNHSVDFCWGFLFHFFPPCSLIALALEKRSLFHSLSHHDLPLLSHPVQCFGYPTFHHYSMLMLVDAKKRKKEQLRSYCRLILLCCWGRFLQGRQ